jgi:cytochrome c-type biogenesis protein CcmH/NrfG
LKERSISLTNSKEVLTTNYALTSELLAEKQLEYQQIHSNHSENSEKLAKLQEEKKELLNELTTVHQNNSCLANETNSEEESQLISKDPQQQDYSFRFLVLTIFVFLIAVVIFVLYKHSHYSPSLIDFASLNSYFDSIVFDDEVLL